MKLTFKDLKQQKFNIEVEPSETIAQVKEKIQGEKGWESNTQKLIYSGKILQDVNTVESYSIEEKGFIVCMTSKPKAAPSAPSTSAAPSTPAPSSSQTPVAPAAPAPVSSNTSNAPATPSPAPTSGTPADFNDPSALALGAQREAAISNMESMGFPRAEIDRAMRAAYFNPDRAVEYLLNGIPENIQQEQRQQAAAGTGGNRPANTPASPPPAQAAGTAASPAPAAPAASASAEEGDQPINLFEAAAQANRGGGAGGARSNRGSGDSAGAGGAAAVAGAAAGLAASAGTGAGGEGAGLGNLEFLRNNPQFQQLRQIVQTQPRMLEPILQQVGHGNPQLAQLIGENPDQFLRLLSEDVGDDVPLPPGAQEISVSEEERDAIERLCRLGFERDLVIQAYFACDKNEELAANFLFDQPEDGDEGGAAT
ncbi:uncharacterized protein KY384_003731 [Bacidia gigantensis]|uniref:uncharacterized protein n=1 Tax=Bacidia gigantensis TaxID=2732470 RepID=UPI001D04FFDF|nr:uncharacterized protein KY384_003731 [Bacidia gigantensis]KAG8532094.1 hypothetical protein KY384_003731 [Bacidia gigantensis]